MIQVERILLPVDFSPHSEAAARHACALADRFGAKLHVLHVVENLAATLPEAVVRMATWPEQYLERAETAALERLSGFLDADWRRGRNVVHATRVGSPFVEILRYAGEHDIGLIVMGTHGRSGFQRAILGSVAERVVRHATCPVLTVRRPEDEDDLEPVVGGSSP